MPRYEFRCRSCGDTFEVDRPMSAAGDPVDCPQGHADTVKLLSTVALGGRATDAAGAARPMAGAGGGCCGGACGCGGG
ncbi:MAG TPA: zinc ribbon domain-containing protein [Natronosporangium sp.]